MELLQVFFTSIGAITFLFLLTKLIGERQLSELSMFEYINGITIGSIAAEMATALEADFLKPLIAMTVFAGITVLFSLIGLKSLKARRSFTGKSIILYDNGVLFRKNLSSAKIDLNEFLVQCRLSGYFNLSEIQTAILETNGKISFLPAVSSRPVTPSDLNLSPEQDFLVANVIIDGEIMESILKKIDRNSIWLTERLKEQNIYDIKNVFLATCDRKGNVSAFLKNDDTPGKDLFE